MSYKSIRNNVENQATPAVSDRDMQDIILKGRFANTEIGEAIEAERQKEDKLIADIVKENSKFKHYKRVNTKSKFDELPDNLQQLINNDI